MVRTYIYIRRYTQIHSYISSFYLVWPVPKKQTQPKRWLRQSCPPCQVSSGRWLPLANVPGLPTPQSGHCKNHPSSLFLLDRGTKPHARREDIKGLTMGAQAIDLFKTTAAKSWHGEKICGVSVHLCIFHLLIRSDGRWVNTVSRSYLRLLRTQTWGLD